MSFTSPSPGSSGRWGSTERVGVEAVAFCQRLNELELRVHAAETEATEHNIERYTAERDFCNGLSKLDAHLGTTTNALGEALAGLVQEGSLLATAKADPWVASDP